MAHLMSRRGAAHAPLALCLGVFLALACVPLVRVHAADEPPMIAPFTTSHIRVEGSISTQGQDRPVLGEGDVDAGKGTSHLTITLFGATSETITIAGRIYSRNATTGRWEYSDSGGGGFDPSRLAIYDPATIRAAGKTFTRIGPETINGEATTRWRADVDLPSLLGAIPGADGGTARLTMSTMNLWLGDGDERLRQLTLDAQGTATNGTATTAYRLALTLTYGKFDTDVAIIAPTGAVAATPTRGVASTPAVGTTGGASGAAPVPTLTPIGEVTSDVGLFSATHIVRLVAILSLVVIGAVLVVAVRHGGRQQCVRPSTRSRR